jgi:hypothetical protein
MPRRRQYKKGSFDSHFDEIVRHFPNDPPQPTAHQTKPKRECQRKQRSVHDLLLEKAWNHAREEDQRNNFSNQ